MKLAISARSIGPTVNRAWPVCCGCTTDRSFRGQGPRRKHVMHLLRGYFAGELGVSRRHRVAHGRHAVPAHRVDRSHCDRSRRDAQLWRAGGEAWVCQIRAGGGRGKRRQSDQRGRAVSSRDRRRWLAHRLWRRHRAQAMATRSRERGFPWQAGSCGGQFNRRSVMCFGSGFSSPFSTRLTMSVSTTLAGVAMPISSPFFATMPLRNSISVRRPFTMS